MIVATIEEAVIEIFVKMIKRVYIIAIRRKTKK